MANYEDTSPRTDIIVFVTVLTVVSLLAYAWGGSSYFTAQAEDEVYEKVLTRGGEVAARAQAEAQKALQSGPMPIERAMKKLATDGRLADERIKPEPSNQIDPLVGWAFHPDHDARKARIEAEKTDGMQPPADDASQETEAAGTKENEADEGPGTSKPVTPEAGQAKSE